MVISKEEKQQQINEFRIHERDGGSPEIQIAILSQRIEELSKHIQLSPKDFHSKRGLLQMVGKRRKLLRYLKRINPERYKNLLGKLGLRK
ncbi:MAG TPA: 30S ribosomal protein S15 [Thermodesulfobacteriota bacterium]|jgi:small subunit ribosomal protein S15